MGKSQALSRENQPNLQTLENLHAGEQGKKYEAGKELDLKVQAAKTTVNEKYSKELEEFEKNYGIKSEDLEITEKKNPAEELAKNFSKRALDVLEATQKNYQGNLDSNFGNVDDAKMVSRILKADTNNIGKAIENTSQEAYITLTRLDLNKNLLKATQGDLKEQWRRHYDKQERIWKQYEGLNLEKYKESKETTGWGWLKTQNEAGFVKEFEAEQEQWEAFNKFDSSFTGKLEEQFGALDGQLNTLSQGAEGRRKNIITDIQTAFHDAKNDPEGKEYPALIDEFRIFYENGGKQNIQSDTLKKIIAKTIPDEDAQEAALLDAMADKGFKKYLEEIITQTELNEKVDEQNKKSEIGKKEYEKIDEWTQTEYTALKEKESFEDVYTMDCFQDVPREIKGLKGGKAIQEINAELIAQGVVLSEVYQVENFENLHFQIQIQCLLAWAFEENTPKTEFSKLSKEARGRVLKYLEERFLESETAEYSQEDAERVQSTMNNLQLSGGVVDLAQQCLERLGDRNTKNDPIAFESLIKKFEQSYESIEGSLSELNKTELEKHFEAKKGAEFEEFNIAQTLQNIHTGLKEYRTDTLSKYIDASESHEKKLKKAQYETSAREADWKNTQLQEKQKERTKEGSLTSTAYNAYKKARTNLEKLENPNAKKELKLKTKTSLKGKEITDTQKKLREIREIPFIERYKAKDKREQEPSFVNTIQEQLQHNAADENYKRLVNQMEESDSFDLISTVPVGQTVKLNITPVPNHTTEIPEDLQKAAKTIVTAKVEANYKGQGSILTIESSTGSEQGSFKTDSKIKIYGSIISGGRFAENASITKKNGEPISCLFTGFSL